MKFGGWAISKQLFNFLLDKVPEGGRILEFGSGIGSAELAKHRNITCVEHDPRYVGKHEGIDYIHRPLFVDFYDMDGFDLSNGEYDAILIDGPPGNISQRSKIWKYRHLLPKKRPIWIIVDDVVRIDEWNLFEEIAMDSEGPFEVHSDGKKAFGVVYLP